MTALETGVVARLRELGIEYTRHEHPPVATVEEASQHWAGIDATHCKNLFLRNQKGDRHYLLILEHSKKADLRLSAALFGSTGGGALGGYGNTNEGKVIAASLMDNYNNVVKSVRNQPSLQRDVGTLSDEAGKKVKGGAVFNEGDTIVPKIANVKLFATPAESGKAVATLSKGDEMIFMGEEQNGFLKVESGNGSGWVKKVLVSK